ncbi:MAG: EAL domain-containing protein [Rhodanobacteraceae bacterium]
MNLASPRRFQTKLALAMLGLVLMLEVCSFAAVSWSTRNSAVTQAKQALEVGGRVFKRLLSTRNAQLEQNLAALASDFAFKQAIATGDRLTIASALANQTVRAKADFAFLVQRDGTVVAGTRDAPTGAGRFCSNIFGRAQGRGPLAEVSGLGGRPYQVAIVPVYAPVPIAWVCAGNAMDGRLAADTRALTSLHISFLMHTGHGATAHIVPATPAEMTAALEAESVQPRASGAVAIADIGRGSAEQMTLLLPLADPAFRSVTAVLQSPLQQALEPYFVLRWQLLFIAVVALLIAAMLVVLLARNLSRPLHALVGAAERVTAGDYAGAVEVPGRDEMSQLALAFNRMKSAVAEREERIAFQAFHDALSGLPNRAALLDHLHRTLARAKRDQSFFAMLMIDINRFKEINNTLGHDVGDRVLVEFAHRLESLIRAEDYVARLGGDEFLVVLEGADTAAAIAVAEKLETAFKAPVLLNDLHVNLEPSIGIAVHPDHGDDANVLLRRADLAMYEAKQHARRWQVYATGRDEIYMYRLRLLAELRHAIDDDQIVVHYQPKANIADGAVTSLEALARWRHPELGLIPPDEFIPLAEQSGLIRGLTECVLLQVIRQVSIWRGQGIEPSVSVNLSALDLLNAELPLKLTRWLEEQVVAPEKLVLEITESAVMRNTSYSISVLNRLRKCGVKLSIDDFGTGYSSLSQLKRLPAYELKIDKSFLAQLTDMNGNDAAIVKATIELGHTMGLLVTAEGVETRECLDLLRALHCDSAQGYFIARPMPPEKLKEWLTAHSPQSVSFKHRIGSPDIQLEHASGCRGY